MKSNGSIHLLLFIGITFLVTSCDTFKYANSGTNSNTNIKDAETIQRNKITTYSKNYVGTKYKYAGKDPKGFDCSGFTSYVMGKHNVAISSSSKAQATQGKSIPVDKVKPGDLVFFGKKGGKNVSHVALVVSNESDGIYVIHSTTSKGVMIQNISKSSYWKPKILFARDVLSD